MTFKTWKPYNQWKYQRNIIDEATKSSNPGTPAGGRKHKQILTLDPLKQCHKVYGALV